MNAPTTHNASNANDEHDPILRAHAHICMAHVFEPFDSEAAMKHESLAWYAAYALGFCSADDVAMPELFSRSRTLTFGWEKARRDRATDAAE